MGRVIYLSIIWVWQSPGFFSNEMSFVAQPLQSGLFSFFPTWKGAIVCTPLMTMVIDDYQAAILIYRLSYKPWLLLRYRTERTGHDRIPIIIGIWCIPNYKLQKNIANNFCHENVQLFTTSAGCCTNKRNYYFLTFLCMATVFAVRFHVSNMLQLIRIVFFRFSMHNKLGYYENSGIKIIWENIYS